MEKRILTVLLTLIVIINLTACSKNLTDLSGKSSNELVSVETYSEPVKIGEDLYIEKLAEKTFVANHEFPWPANSLIVEMSNSDIVLVDTPYTPEATKELLKWMKSHFGDRKIVVINTGFHFDNLGGNKALIENNIPIYGSDLTPKLIKTHGEASRELMLKWLEKPESKRFFNAYKEIPYIAPNKLFKLKEVEKLIIGSEEIEIYYPGESHSPDNVVVYFPHNNILFGGCMIKDLGSNNLGNTADANLKEWPKSVLKVLNRYKKAEIVVPGHGKSGNRDLIAHTLGLCESIQ